MSNGRMVDTISIRNPGCRESSVGSSGTTTKALKNGGERFTIADAYLYPILRLGCLAGLDFSRWPAVVRDMDEIAKRFAVRAAMQAEDLPGDEFDGHR